MSLTFITAFLNLAIFAGIAWLAWAFFTFKPGLVPSEKYAYPPSAIGVGNVLGDPPMHYMYIWHDKEAKRLKMEFRNMRGYVVCADARVILPLAGALKRLADSTTDA